MQIHTDNLAWLQFQFGRAWFLDLVIASKSCFVTSQARWVHLNSDYALDRGADSDWKVGGMIMASVASKKNVVPGGDNPPQKQQK